MAKKKIAKLSDICALVTDGTHDTPQTLEKGVPFIKAKEIVGGIIDFDNCEHISYEDHLKVIARSNPRKGDVLFAHIGASLGEAAFIKTDREFSIKNIALFKPNPSIVDNRYLYYYILSHRFQNEIKGCRTGAAQPFVSLEFLRNHHIEYHSNIEIQRKIATALSNYDDLIENNNRRIKILEEMAQTIYDEWFVKFRFPGHSKVKMVDSPLGKIPEGWGVKKLDEVVDNIILGGTPARKNPEYWGGEIPWIKSGKLNDLRVIEGTETITEAGLLKSATKMMPKRTVLIAITGAIFISLSEIELCANQSVVGIYDSKKLSQEYIYLYQKKNINQFISKMSGSAQQHVNKEIIRNSKILIPDLETMNNFNKMIKPVFNELKNLIFKNQNLRKTRGLLLPKLISGEIDVEDLDINVGELAK